MSFLLFFNVYIIVTATVKVMQGPQDRNKNVYDYLYPTCKMKSKEAGKGGQTWGHSQRSGFSQEKSPSQIRRKGSSGLFTT